MVMSTAGVGDSRLSVAVLWRGDRDAGPAAIRENPRLRPIFEAFADLGVSAEPALYGEEFREDIRDQLMRVDGVLVWVDPVSGDRDRSRLDPLLREVAEA